YKNSLYLIPALPSPKKEGFLFRGQKTDAFAFRGQTTEDRCARFARARQKLLDVGNAGVGGRIYYVF
ncbi:hypothetical protein BES34_009375, partial [Leptospira inadai serovar Lyme]